MIQYLWIYECNGTENDPMNEYILVIEGVSLIYSAVLITVEWVIKLNLIIICQEFIKQKANMSIFIVFNFEGNSKNPLTTNTKI